MNIGQASKSTGLPAKTIRYYEEIGLVHPLRADNGYRNYDEKNLHELNFLQRSRSLGFSIDECRQLLALYQDSKRASSTVKSLALGKIEQIETKIFKLEQMKMTLEHLVENCHGDNRPECPIIEDLAKAGKELQ